MRRALRKPDVIDGALLFVLSTLAIFGFRDTYYGYAYLVAGVIGLVLGVALATLTRQLGQPPVVLLAGVVAVFFLLGGVVALHGLGGTNLLPVPHTLQQLADCVVHGWKQLLTTLPPVDGGPLLALPYLLGLVAGAAGIALAHVRWAPAPVLVPLLLMGLVILLGVKDPQRTAITAAVFAALTIVWLVVRARRRRVRVVAAGSRRAFRRATSGALCAGVAVVAVAAGPHLPGLKDDRVVLRSHVTPPFNVGQYASPLAAFRRFTKGYLTTSNAADALYDKPVLRVSPSLVGVPLRIAALDSYDGNVWGAGNVAASSVDPETSTDDTFQKVGRHLVNPAVGTRVSGTVTILDGDPNRPGSSSMNVWLPTAGSLTGIAFQHPDEEQGSDEFRYNLATSTGVLPGGLAKGTSYTFQAIEAGRALTPRTRLASGGLPEVDASTFEQLATTWAGKAANPTAQVEAVAAYLHQHGHYTDGEKGFEFYPAGDSLFRLRLFTSTRGQLAGNDEQFAAMMALAANALGVPARVVVGATPEKSGLVKGQDIHAWVELQAADGSWRTLPTSDFMNMRKPRHQKEQPQRSLPASNIPPPAPIHPPATAGAPLDNSLSHRFTAVHDKAVPLPGFVWVLVKYLVLPLLLLILVYGGIVGAKRWRRRRRRTRGSPSHQLAMAWLDLLDHVRDHGLTVPTRATRREQARALAARQLALPDLTSSARRADAVMFAREEPSAAAVGEYWAEVDDLRRQVSSSRTRWQRVRATLNLGTFRPRSTTFTGAIVTAGRRAGQRPVAEEVAGA